MKSTIKIDFQDRGQGKGLEPVIAIRMVNSDDVRDGLLRTFFQSLGHTSSFLKVNFDHHIIKVANDLTTIISILPVRPEELEKTQKDLVEIIESDKKQKGGQPANYSPLFSKENSEYIRR